MLPALEKQLTEPEIYRPQHAEDFVFIQERFGAQQAKQTPRWSKLFTRSVTKTKHPSQSGNQAPIAKRKHRSRRRSYVKYQQTGGLVPITDLFNSASNGINQNSLGLIIGEYDRSYEIIRLSPPALLSETVELTTLADLLEKATPPVLKKRFEIAASLACAVLQLQFLPWLSGKWSKHDFHFLIDSGSLYSKKPHVSEDICLGSDLAAIATEPGQGTSLALGGGGSPQSLCPRRVIFLELIFGHSIEKYPFRLPLLRAEKRPNNQTDVSTAWKWSQKVLGEK